jgi:hypothetical protein
MSTRSVIARVGEHEGEFSGVYHHSDGYPTGLGAYLWKHLHQHFKGNLATMLRTLIDEHASGWSSSVAKDFRLKPGYTWQRASNGKTDFETYSKLPDYRRPQCFCHGDRHEDLKDNKAGLEWLYIFDEKENRMYVRDLGHGEELIIYLDKEEPIWTEIECGQDYARSPIHSLTRCSHYASFHGLAPKGSNLSTQAYLGNRPLEFHDAIAFIANGKRYKATGNGGNSEYLNAHKGSGFPPNTWIATVVASNGRRVDLPVAQVQDGKYVPLPGVAWVYPPTMVAAETLVEAQR